MTQTRHLTITLLTLGLLAGCTNVKSQLGLQRSAPDEFSVVDEAPLAMPPDYALRPPQPGAARPQDTPTIKQAQETVFGNDADESSQHVSNANDTLLQLAGAQSANPNIRAQVDREMPTGTRRTTALQKLHVAGPSPTPANVVNAPVEAARLNGNAANGKALTTGTTTGIQQ